MSLLKCTFKIERERERGTASKEALIMAFHVIIISFLEKIKLYEPCFCLRSPPILMDKRKRR
jgi:hypothetical protein